jgi:hypothetical protein
VSHQDDANLKIIISRIQQRRGLKQDLPHPLRPGEIGFATDSKQVYIGADTDDAISATYNKTVSLERTLGASARTLSLSNVQVVKFTVPHIRFPKGSGEFDGVTKSKSWKANTQLLSSTDLVDSSGNTVTRNVFNDAVSSSNFINQNQTSRSFTADDVTVLINGEKESGDSSGTGALVNTAFDYNFVSGNSSTSDHTLYLRYAPENSDDVAITYYGNTHVNHILSNTTIASGSSLTGFHANMSVPEYRYIDSDLVVVNPQVGTGFIGLEQKHIDVVSEGLGIANISNISVDHVVFVKDPADPSLTAPDPSNANAVIYSGVGNVTSVVDHANSTITFDTGNENLVFTELANASGGYNGYVWTEAGSTDHTITPVTNTYYHRKLLPISANSVANTFTVDLPSNAWSTGRSVTASVDSSNTVTISSDLSGILVGDEIYFEGNATLESNGPYTVDSINTGSSTFAITEPLLTAGIASGLDAINTGQSGVSNVVQLYSTDHGYTANTTTGIIVSGSTDTALIDNANFDLSDYVISTNTFYVQATGNVTTNISGTFTPNVGDLIATDGLTIKQGYVLDISSETTVNGVMSLVNGQKQWFNVNLKPDKTDELYITSDDQTQYRLFNDPRDSVDSLGSLGFSDKYHATRSNNTVKAKLEVWLSKVLNDDKVNIITDVFINDKFSDNANVQLLGTWKIDVDTTNDEINFDSNDEAGNFAELVNKLYFRTNDPDKRGLVTIKTNIEMLTTQSLESGQSETFYSQPQQLTIGTGQGIQLTDLGTDATAIDTLFIDYSIVGSALDSTNSAVTRYYNQVGTLFYNANSLSGEDANGNISGSITLQDVSSSSHDSHANGDVYYAGSIDFSGNIANGIVSISADNNITPPTSNAVMKYTVRKWKS